MKVPILGILVALIVIFSISNASDNTTNTPYDQLLTQLDQALERISRLEEELAQLKGPKKDVVAERFILIGEDRKVYAILGQSRGEKAYPATSLTIYNRNGAAGFTAGVYLDPAEGRTAYSSLGISESD